jgi:hypothetical protein
MGDVVDKIAAPVTQKLVATPSEDSVLEEIFAKVINIDTDGNKL